MFESSQKYKKHITLVELYAEHLLIVDIIIFFHLFWECNTKNFMVK